MPSVNEGYYAGIDALLRQPVAYNGLFVERRAKPHEPILLLRVISFNKGERLLTFHQR